MLVWSGLLFLLGVLAFIDSVFNMGDVFRRANSVIFLLVSLALLIRTATKARQQDREQAHRRLMDLEREVYRLKEDQKKLVDL
ncbi:MAG: hypothetical protein KKA42_10115 [candidate division Zixibacteria bacterium]|nr:hypothetical protein [candidate division Zixibacteria bacterium]